MGNISFKSSRPSTPPHKSSISKNSAKSSAKKAKEVIKTHENDLIRYINTFIDNVLKLYNDSLTANQTYKRDIDFDNCKDELVMGARTDEKPTPSDHEIEMYCIGVIRQSDKSYESIIEKLTETNEEIRKKLAQAIKELSDKLHKFTVRRLFVDVPQTGGTRRISNESIGKAVAKIPHVFEKVREIKELFDIYPEYKHLKQYEVPAEFIENLINSWVPSHGPGRGESSGNVMFLF